MRLLLALVVVGFFAQVHADVIDPKCFAMHMLSKHHQALDPAHGDHNWEVQGDYSGTHVGPGTVASLDESGGWRLDGFAAPFQVYSENMQLVFLEDVTSPYKSGSLGADITFKSAGTLFNFADRPNGPAPGMPEDLNHDIVSNEFGVGGDLAFTVTRKVDGQSYSGVFQIQNQVYPGTAFNGLGFFGQEFVDETLTVWLWGTEVSPGASGYSFLKNDPTTTKPLAVDLVISGEYVDCDSIGEANDPCTAIHTCDPEQCGDDCECILHTTVNCGKLNVVPGSLGACSVTVP